MIDTIKFAIPLVLADNEISKINWTQEKSIVKEGKSFITNVVKDTDFVGSPYITYTYKENDHTQSLLRVEVSLPKFRYGTNLYELDDREVEWTLNFLKLYLAQKLKLHPSKIPHVDKWAIKKLHICKNFNVGQDMQLYMSAASKTVLPQHKTHTYAEKGGDRLQSVIWVGKTRKEKFYNKYDEIIENQRQHYEYKIIEPIALGVLRYEVELSYDEIKSLTTGNTTLEVLSSKIIIPKLNRGLKRLNLNHSLKDLKLKELIRIIEMNDSLKTSTKSSLIAFASKYITMGLAGCKSTYSESGYKKVKTQFNKVMGSKERKYNNSKIRELNVVDFNFTKERLFCNSMLQLAESTSI